MLALACDIPGKFCAQAFVSSNLVDSVDLVFGSPAKGHVCN